MPGTVSVIEPEQQDPPLPPHQDLTLSPHELDPAGVLRLVSTLGGTCRRVLLVACEPLTFGGEQGVMGLSEPVAEAVGVAASVIEDIIGELLAMPREQAPMLVVPAREQLSEQGAKS